MAAGAGWRKGRSWALLSVCHTLPKHHISRMRARSTHRSCLQHFVGAAAARESSRERRCVRRTGDGAGGGSSDGAGGGSSEAGRQQLARADRRPVGAREATESGTALRGVSQDRVARGLTITSTSVDPPLSLPQSPSLSLLDAGRSRADFLSGVRVALIGRDRPLLLTYLFAEGT